MVADEIDQGLHVIEPVKTLRTLAQAARLRLGAPGAHKPSLSQRRGMCFRPIRGTIQSSVCWSSALLAKGARSGMKSERWQRSFEVIQKWERLYPSLVIALFSFSFSMAFTIVILPEFLRARALIVLLPLIAITGTLGILLRIAKMKRLREEAEGGDWQAEDDPGAI